MKLKCTILILYFMNFRFRFSFKIFTSLANCAKYLAMCFIYLREKQTLFLLKCIEQQQQRQRHLLQLHFSPPCATWINICPTFCLANQPPTPPAYQLSHMMSLLKSDLKKYSDVIRLGLVQLSCITILLIQFVF